MTFVNGIILSSTEVHLLTIVLKHAETLAIDMEADKNQNRLECSQYVEVKLLNAIQRLDKEFKINIDHLRALAALPPLREDL